MVQTAGLRRSALRMLNALVAFALATTVLATLTPSAEAALPEVPTACGPIIEDETGRYCVTASGLMKTFSSTTGEFLGYIHGGDPRPVDIDPFADDAPPAEGDVRGAPQLTGSVYADDRAPHCVTPSSPYPEYYAQVIYLRYYNQQDTYNENVDLIRGIVRQANGLLHDTAKELGKPLLYKVKCTAGNIDVANAVLPNACSDADCFNDMVTQLRSLGYQDTKVKYWVWTEDTRCTCGGKGHVFPDDSLSIGNRNNGNAATPMFAVTFHGDTGVRVMMHENGHNMGAVQDYSNGENGANNQGHCWDGSDIMCYTEPGEARSYSNSVCPGSDHWDCNSDTYFHPKPPAGSYLADHWNLGSPLNRYLVAGNAMPDPADDMYTIQEDAGKALLEVLKNDEDEEDDPLYIHDIAAPASGAAVLVENNRIAYTPPADYYGIESFNYTVRDRADAGNESVMFGNATVTVEVRPLNDAPRTADSTVTTPEDTPIPLTLDALDVENDPLSWTLSTPIRGTIEGVPPEVTYRPDPDVTGIDAFTFTVTDPFGLSSTGRVEIGILSRPDPPRAQDDVVVAIEGIDWPLLVMENDDAGPGEESLTETIAIQSYGPGGISVQGGTLSTDDGDDPLATSDDLIIYRSPPGYTGTDSFEYTIVDNGNPAYTATATVTVQVQPDELAAFPDAYETSEDTILEVAAGHGVLHKPSPAIPPSMVAAGKDPADHWPSKPSMAGIMAALVDPPLGTLDLRGDGSFTYTPPADFHGIDSFTYRIETPEGPSNVARVQITVASVNDAPVVEDLEKDLVEDEWATIPLTGTDIEDDAEGLPLSFVVVRGPEHGRLDDSATPVLRYVPDPQFSGEDSFVYRAIDSANASSDATVRLVIQAENDPPTAAPDHYLARPDRTNLFPVGQSPLENDHDADGDALRLELVRLPRHGEVALSADGGFTYTPPPGFLGADHFTYKAFDPHGAVSLPATVTIDVAHNIPPSAFFEFTHTAFSAGVFVGLREASRDLDGDIVSWSWDFGDGNTSAERVPLHAYGAPGDYQVTLRVRDTDAAEGVWSESIHIVGEFGASLGGTLQAPLPVAHAGDDLVAVAGDHVQLDATQSFAEQDIVAYQWIQRGGPAVELHDADRPQPYFEAPAPADGARYSVLTFELKVFDGNQESLADEVQVTVHPKQASPRIVADAGPDQTTLSGVVVETRASAMNAIGPVTYTWTQTGGPPVTILQGGASMQFETPYVAQRTTFRFEVVAQTAEAASAPDMVNVTVEPSVAPAGFAAHGSGTERTFQASTGVETAALDYVWDFGDGTTANGTEAKHTFAEPGTYTVRLTASNQAGYSGSWQQEVVVEPEPEAQVVEEAQPESGSWIGVAAIALAIIACLGAASVWLARRAHGDE